MFLFVPVTDTVATRRFIQGCITNWVKWTTDSGLPGAYINPGVFMSLCNWLHLIWFA